MFIITCLYATVIYCYTVVVNEWIFKKHDFYIEYIRKPMLGPLNLNEVCYKFRNRTYKVIIDLNRTNIDTFKQKLMKTKLPLIPNRAIAFKSCDDVIDIEMFNEYLGPTCDFYSSFVGIYTPYTVDYFFKNSQNLHETITIIDTLGLNVICTKMSSIKKNFKWYNDCTIHRFIENNKQTL
jgi:hypothetical protein